MSGEQIRPGYKRTEVGVIPADWEVSTVGRNSIWSSGGTPSRDREEYWGGTIPWISGSTLKNIEISTSDQFLTADGVSAGSKMAPLNSTLLLVRGSALHNEIRAGLVVAPVAFNQDVKALAPTGNLEPKFFVYFILAHSEELLKLVSSAGNSAGVLDTELVQRFKLFLPPRQEQDAIASALSDVDTLLAKLEQLIAKKRDLKQAAMQQLLTGQTRLPGFSGEWEVKRLGDVILRCFSGATPRRNRPDFYKGDIRWITSGELRYGVINDTLEKISAEAVTETNLTILPAGTFLMAITGLEAEGTRGACGIVGAPSATNQSCMAIFPTSELKTEFLFHYYVYKGKELALEYCQGTKQQSYTASIVKRLPISLPPSVQEQTAIASVLSNMSSELAVLEMRREKVCALKQGMMQELLTGRIRLL